MQIAFYWSSKDMNNVNVAFLASFLQTLGNHDDVPDISIDYATGNDLNVQEFHQLYNYGF